MTFEQGCQVLGCVVVLFGVAELGLRWGCLGAAWAATAVNVWVGVRVAWTLL